MLALVVVILPVAPADDLSPTQRTRAAKAAFVDGKRSYDIGKFEEALASFERAYELKPAPLLLFNMGQCYRGLGDHEKAVFLFRRFLSEDPRTRERPLVEELIADSEAKADEARRLEMERARRAVDFERLEEEFERRLEALRTMANEGLSEEELARKQADLEALQERQAELARLRSEMEGLTAPAERAPDELGPAELLARQAALEEQAREASARHAELERLAVELRSTQEALRAERLADEERARSLAPPAPVEPVAAEAAPPDEEGAWWLWPAVGGTAAGVAALAAVGVTTGVVVVVAMQASQPRYLETLDWRE